MVRTPVQVHSLSAVSMPAKWSEHPCMCTRSALYPCQRNGTNTRSSALAQHCIHASQMVRLPVQVHLLSTCIHASQMVRTPVHVHSLSTVSMPAKWSEHPCMCTRSALYPCQPNGKNNRASALAQHCIHASQMVRTPVQAHSLSTVSMPAKW